MILINAQLKLNKKLIPLTVFFTLLITMVLYPNKYTIVLFPLINFMVICFTFRDEILNFNFNTIKGKWFRDQTRYSFFFAIVSQALANAVSLYILKIQAPDISFAYNIIAASAVSVIFSSINEEIIYRYILFGSLDKRYGFWVGSIVSSIIFTISHYNYSGWLGYFAVAMAWSFAYKRTGNIAINILVHMIINLVFFVKYSLVGF